MIIWGYPYFRKPSCLESIVYSLCLQFMDSKGFLKPIRNRNHIVWNLSDTEWRSAGVANMMDRKMRSTKVWSNTVASGSMKFLIPQKTEGETQNSTYSYFLLVYNSCWALVVFHNCLFTYISHLYQLYSIIAWSIIMCSLIKHAINTL